ncbi:chemosensory receptor B [Elysia marginata]|uniref:Chemosensory receptor B n=1 Tax=Elysia marginata TaxID=1093978 RepID=A0AAV4GRT7_9GAST|nr:chemosensory receptor B [Elysia marginata]
MSSALNTSASQVVLSGFLSGQLYLWLMGLVLVLTILVASFATGANIVTIIVYNRLGYTDTTSISLTALAVSDMGVAATTYICVLAYFLPMIPNAPFTYAMFLSTGPAPHTLFSRVSALITTYVSIERYLCVLIPMKVKSVFTPRRTVVAMTIIFVAIFTLYPIVFLRFPVGWISIPQLNISLIAVIPVTDYDIITLYNIAGNIASVYLPLLIFPTMFFTTVGLALTLKKSKKWRDANAAGTTRGSSANGVRSTAQDSAAAATSSKESRAVKMVILITTVFILSLLPSCFHLIAQILFAEFSPGGRFTNLYFLVNMFVLTADCANCSANVIIYYKMSTRFRLATQDLFMRGVRQKRTHNA